MKSLIRTVEIYPVLNLGFFIYLQPKSPKLGKLCEIQIKTVCNDQQTLETNVLFTINP